MRWPSAMQIGDGAMLEEMKAIKENKTWELIDPPPGYRPIGLKWVYKVKRDEHMEQPTATKDSGNLLLTEEEWAARRNSGKASSSCGGDGKRRGKASSEKKKKKVDPNACRRCGKTGHWAKTCPNRKQEKKTGAHLTQADEDDDATLLMAMFCALHDIEAKEKGEVMTVEGHDKALKAVNLDVPRTQANLGCVGGE